MYVARAHTVSLAGILMTKREREPEVRGARGGQVRVTTTSPRSSTTTTCIPLEQIGADNRSGFAHCVDRTRRATRGSPLPPPPPPIRLHTISVHHL